MNKIIQTKIYLLGKFIATLFIAIIATETIHAGEVNPDYVLAQQIKQQRITINIKNKPVKYILNEIHKKSGIGITFKDAGEIEELGNLSINVVNLSVEEILTKLLANSRFTYKIVKGAIIIIPAPVPSKTDQNKTSQGIITGSVLDTKKRAIVGATIIDTKSNVGAITNDKGFFSLKSGVGAVIEVSYVGKNAQTISVLNNKPLTIILEDDMMNVDDVIVTGIFNKAKESFTGAATFISKQELKDFKSNNLLKTINNIDPSFNIVENNKMGSNPNVLPEINIRGTTSVPSDLNSVMSNERANLNTPLFIFDGFEISLERMLDLDPEEVESITILKDASSTAMYGSRGSNGVVVISSVKPQSGKLKISVGVNMNLEFPDLSSYNLLNAREKFDLECAAGYYTGKTSEAQHALNMRYNEKKRLIMEGVDTYWLSQPLRSGVSGSYRLSLGGGDKSFRYSLSAAYSEQKGVMKRSDRNNFNATLTLTYLYENFQFNNMVSAGINNSSNSSYGQFNEYVSLNPYWAPYDDKGDLVMTFVDNVVGNVNNPLYNSLLPSFDKSEYTNIRNTTSFEWKPLKELKIGGQFGFNKQFGESNKYLPQTHSLFNKETDLAMRGSYDYSTKKQMAYNLSLTMSFAKVIKKHSVFVGFQGSMDESVNNNFGTKVKGFSHEMLNYISMGAKYSGDVPMGKEATSRSVGITANANYSYNSCVYIDASYRLDGQSSFGSYNRFKPFYSVGLGWTASRMEFFQKNIRFINTLRFRYSYGVSGSLPFEPYQALTTYVFEPDNRYENIVGAIIKGYGNPNLTWQYTYSHNLGTSMDFLKNKFSFNFNVYTKLTKGTITSANLSPTHGYNNYTENRGDIKNSGYDISLSYKIINDTNRQIQWSVRGSFQQNKNILLKLSEAMKENSKRAEQANQKDPNFLYREGESMNALYVYPSYGIDPGSGRELFVLRNGGVSFDPDERNLVNYGLSEPKVTGSLSTSFRYQGLSVNLSFSLRLGGQKYNTTLVSKVENADIKQNVDKRVYDDRWRGINHYAKYKGLTTSTKNVKSSRFVQNESTFNCNTLNINYAAPAKFVKKYFKVSALSATLNTTDLFNLSTVKLERGTSYPFSRKITLTLSVTF